MKTEIALLVVFLVTACASQPSGPAQMPTSMRQDGLQMCADFCYAQQNGSVCLGLANQGGGQYAPICAPKDSVTTSAVPVAPKILTPKKKGK